MEKQQEETEKSFPIETREERAVLHPKEVQQTIDFCTIRSPVRETGKKHVHWGLLPGVEVTPEDTPEVFEMAEEAFKEKDKIVEDLTPLVGELAAKLEYMKVKDGCDRDERGFVAPKTTYIAPKPIPKAESFPLGVPAGLPPAYVRYLVPHGPNGEEPPEEELLKLGAPEEVMKAWTHLTDNLEEYHPWFKETKPVRGKERRRRAREKKEREKLEKDKKFVATLTGERASIEAEMASIEEEKRSIQVERSNIVQARRTLKESM